MTYGMVCEKNELVIGKARP